jgi:hypothetical protein
MSRVLPTWGSIQSQSSRHQGKEKTKGMGTKIIRADDIMLTQRKLIIIEDGQGVGKMIRIHPRGD